MSRAKSWTFPRWGNYGTDRDPVAVRMCDRDGCGEKGDHPAPKSRYSEEKWWFCQSHAAEYNAGWNFFAGMSDEEAKQRAADDERTARGYANANTWGWSNDSGDESGYSPQARKALAVMGLDAMATPDQIKTQFRQLAKKFHPDANPGDEEAANKFRALCAAYEVLREREDRQPA